MNFTQFLNHNVEIPGRRLQSPSLKEVAWLEDVQLLLLNFPYICLWIWQGRQTCRRGLRGKNEQTKVWKILKNSSATSSTATSFKLGEYNLLPNISMFWFTNCEKFNSGKRYLPLDSHTNTAISDCFAYLSMASKTVIGPIQYNAYYSYDTTKCNILKWYYDQKK